MIFVVDTHGLTRYLEGSSRLGAAARRAFNDPQAILVIPTIVLAEAHHMIFRGKTSLVWPDIVRAIEMDGRLIPLELTVDVVGRISHQFEMHDGIIVATATMLEDAADEEVRLITRDRRIRDSGLVQTVW